MMIDKLFAVAWILTRRRTDGRGSQAARRPRRNIWIQHRKQRPVPQPTQNTHYLVSPYSLGETAQYAPTVCAYDYAHVVRPAGQSNNRHLLDHHVSIVSCLFAAALEEPSQSIERETERGASGWTGAKSWIIKRVGVWPWRNGHKERRPPSGWVQGCIVEEKPS